MEVVEHVADIELFVSTCAAMVKPGGLMIAATLNRTLKSFALAIVGAEYVLRWLPRGTHQWDKFVTPQELETAIENTGLRVIGERGVIYNPFADRWQLSSDMDVNYMLVAAQRQRAGRKPHDPRTRRIQFTEGLEPARRSPKRRATSSAEVAGQQGIAAQAFPARARRQDRRRRLRVALGRGRASSAHDEAWRQSVIKRTGSAPTIRYFDLFLLIDNEHGKVSEFPEAAEINSAAA